MKKYFSILILLLIVLFQTSCKEKSKIKVIIPSGTPLVAVGGVLDEVDYNVVIGQDLLINAFTSNDVDVIIAPLVLGAKMYIASTTNFKLNSIITFGNSYIISKSDKPLENISDLEGKTIAAYGNNSTPSIILNKALDKYNVKSEIEYYPAITDLVGPFTNNVYDYILTAEPTLTNLEAKIKDLKVINLQDLIVENSNLEFIPQAAIFVKQDNLNTQQISDFIDKVKENIEFLNLYPNDYAKKIINKNQFFTKMGEDVISKSIARSNIGFIRAKDNQNQIEEFFNMINEYNTSILSNKLPNSEFYY